jgi:DNA-directed RNA polymerase subunit omega
MARVTVEDCLDREENRFALVLMAAQRSRQLMRSNEPLVQCKNKPLVTSLREIAAGKVRFDQDTSSVVEAWVTKQRLKNAKPPGHNL